MASTSTPLRVVFLDRETISPETVLRPLSFPHVLNTYGRTRTGEVPARMGDANSLIVSKVRLGAGAIAAAPRLRMIALAATGSDNIALAACRERGIVLSNIRGYARTTVPEHVFALI